MKTPNSNENHVLAHVLGTIIVEDLRICQQWWGLSSESRACVPVYNDILRLKFRGFPYEMMAIFSFGPRDL